MDENFIDFCGKYYAIDMNKFMAFCASSTNCEKDSQTTITQIYANQNNDEDDMPVSVSFTDGMTQYNGPLSKEIREIKSNCNENFNNIRYDFAKNLLSTLISPYYTRDGELLLQNSEEELCLGQKICFNTLLQQGILIEVK